MHYIKLYIFTLDLYSNCLNHFIWKRLNVTVAYVADGHYHDMQIPDWIMMMCQ